MLQRKMTSRYFQSQINTVGLVAHYKMYEQTVFDYSLNGNTPSPEGILGGELVTNGDFANWSAVATPDDVPANWTETPNAAGNDANNHTTEAIADGTPTDGGSHCKLKSDGTNVFITQNVLTVGKTYIASLEITDTTTGGIKITNSSQNSDSFTTTGVKTWTFTAIGNTNINIQRIAACDVTFKDVSVKEIISPTGLGGDFDGADSIMTVAADSTIDINGKTAYSISAWINPASDGESDTGRICAKVSVPAGYFFYLSDEAASVVKVNVLIFHDGAADSQARTDALLPINTWTNVAFVYNEDSAKKIKIYFNGVLQSLDVNTAGVGTIDDDSAIDLIIGSSATISRTFDGIISDVQIYNKALSAAEVLSIYSQTRGRYSV